jgi:O-antigen/teichoic acid export membrane protein
MPINQTTTKDVKTADTSGQFISDIIWVTIAQLLNTFLVGLVTMPALTKHYTAEIFGIWSQINITVSLLTPILVMQLGSAVVRFLSGEEDKIRRRQALSSILIVTTPLAGVVFVAANFIAPQISTLLFNSTVYTNYVRLTVLWIWINAYFQLFVAYLRARNMIRLLSIRQLVMSCVIMIMVIILSSRGVQLEWVIISVIATTTILTIIFFIMIVREIGWPSPHFTGLKSFLAFSLPQLPGSMLFWIINYSDRYFITHFLGLSKTGIYTTSDILGNLISIFYFPIQFVLFPLVSRQWEQKRYIDVKRYLEDSFKLFITLAIPAAAGLFLLSKPLISWLTTSEFFIGGEIILLIAVGTLFIGIYQINVNIIYLLKKTKLLPFMIGAASLINVVMNIVLIPRLGLIGAAISNIASYLMLAAIVTIWARKTIKYRLDLIYIGKVIGATIMMSACLYFVKLSGSISGIVLSVVLGIAIYLAGLLLLRAFSATEIGFFKSAIGGIIYKLIKK